MTKKQQLERVRTAMRSLDNLMQTLPQVYMSLDCTLEHFAAHMDDNDRYAFIEMRQTIEAASLILQPLAQYLNETED